MQEDPPATEPQEVTRELTKVEYRDVLDTAYLKVHEEVGRKPRIPASEIRSPEGGSPAMKDYMGNMDHDLWSRFEKVCSEMVEARLEELLAEEAKNTKIASGGPG
ncbi:MAG: hypothetical protein LQ345_005903 [Seirophora villosa]|nr:MAG: hypothetical protein LQ345_005903 [Seirophora villosa]